MVSVGERDALAEEVEFGPAVHLSFDHFAVDVAFDGAGTAGKGEAGFEPAQSLRSPAAKPRSSRTGLSSASLTKVPRATAAVAEHAGEFANQVTCQADLLAAGGDLVERCAVGVVELAGRGEDPAGYFLGRGWVARPRVLLPGAVGRMAAEGSQGCSGSRGRGSPDATGRCRGSLLPTAGAGRTSAVEAASLGASTTHAARSSPVGMRHAILPAIVTKCCWSTRQAPPLPVQMARKGAT